MAIRLYNDTQDKKISSKTGAISLYTPEERKKVDESLSVPEVFKPQVKPVEEKSIFDKAKSLVGKVTTKIGDIVNNQQQRADKADFQMRELLYGKPTIKTDPTTGDNRYSTEKLDAFNSEEDPEKKANILKESQQEIPLVKLLNSKAGQEITGVVAGATSNLPLKLAARIKSIGDDTYDEAYSALLEKSKDPSNNRFERIMYGLQDSGVQSAIGVLVGLGVSLATRGKVKPQIITAPYFAAISAESQRQDKGRVESLGNIAIDTIGDTVLSGVAEAALKNIVKEGGEATLKSIIKQSGKGFAVEGSTEVTQSLLKYGNDYKNAKTDEEKQKVVGQLANYINNGGIVDEFLIGGLSGGIITGTAAGLGTVVNPSLQPGGGDIETPKEIPGATKPVDFSKDFTAVRNEVVGLQNYVNTHPADEVAVERLSVLQEDLADYLETVKDRPVYISDDTQEEPLAVIETAKFPDGKVAFSYKVNVPNTSVEQPFLVAQTFKTEKQAINAGKKAVLKWADAKIKDDPALADTLAPVITELRGGQEISEKNGSTKPNVKGKKPLVDPNIQVKDAKISRTKKGGYTLDKYSRKGNVSGRALVAFRRSPKNGKIFMEVELKGERILRMSLESAKKKFGTTDRNIIAARAVNGVFDPKTKKWELRRSTASVSKNKTQNQVEKKPVATKGEVRKSKAFTRVMERLGEYADLDASYNRLNLAKDTANALEFVRTNLKDAKKIALGMMGAPEGITETAISIALAEQAAFEKNYELQAQLERSRSLRQTRRGQEIVAERGRFNVNSPHHFMNEVIAARLQILGKKFLYRSKNGKIETRSQVAQKKIAEGTDSVKATVKKKLSAADLAQNVIDQLTC